jgi:hypothetical protein
MYWQVVHLHLQLYGIELTSEASADFTSKPELSILIRQARAVKVGSEKPPPAAD